MAEVCVHHANDVGARRPGSFDDSRTQAQLPAAVNHLQPMMSGQVIGERPGAVRRVVVDNDHGQAHALGSCAPKEGFDELSKPVALVVGRNDHGQIGPLEHRSSTIIQGYERVTSGPSLHMTKIERYSPEDRRQVEVLYRRVFGADAAESNRLRWQWQYGQNPGAPAGGPPIWLAREGQTVIGQYATLPVRLSVLGQEIDAAWGLDVMVAPERQRQGIGDHLLRACDRNSGASLALGLTASSKPLLEKLRWPNVGPLTALVKPLSRRAFRMPTWPVPVNRFVSYVTLPIVRLAARTRPLEGQVRVIRHFDERFTALWKRVAGRFAFVVRRDASYLNWKFIQPPHVRYTVAALEHADEVAGYAVYRHVAEPLGRVTRLVDFLTDPDDTSGFFTLLRWVDREARAADSDKIRTWVTHDGFRRLFRKSGYFVQRSTLELVAKINAVPVPADYYQSADKWHVTVGDADQDR